MRCEKPGWLLLSDGKGLSLHSTCLELHSGPELKHEGARPWYVRVVMTQRGASSPPPVVPQGVAEVVTAAGHAGFDHVRVHTNDVTVEVRKTMPSPTRVETSSSRPGTSTDHAGECDEEGDDVEAHDSADESGGPLTPSATWSPFMHDLENHTSSISERLKKHQMELDDANNAMSELKANDDFRRAVFTSEDFDEMDPVALLGITLSVGGRPPDPQSTTLWAGFSPATIAAAPPLRWETILRLGGCRVIDSATPAGSREQAVNAVNAVNPVNAVNARWLAGAGCSLKHSLEGGQIGGQIGGQVWGHIELVHLVEGV